MTMSEMQSNAAENAAPRAPYRAPTVEVVLHHSETRIMVGMGRDGLGPIAPANSLS